jgi:OPA family sugar phosphate sensor protein UhpC-like MFS transporter
MSTSVSREWRFWRYRIFAITWVAYAGLYFCRKNFSVVMPMLEHDLGFSKLQLANLIAGFNVMYLIGQFSGGVLSDRFGPRLIVGIGLAVSVCSNILMGLASSLTLFMVLASLNGAGQSTGWPGLVKNMGCWLGRRERGVVMAWWSTNYVAGGFIATVFATFVASFPAGFTQLGWRRGFLAPALVLAVVAVAFVLLARNKPSDVGLHDTTAEEDSLDENDPRLSTNGVQREGSSGSIFLRVLSNPTVWVIASMYFFLKLTRYSILFWLPLYMTEHLGYGVAEAGYTSSVYELVGFSGALIAGYASDKLMQSRRFPVGAVMMWGLALVSLLHPTLAAHGHWGNGIGIGLLGMMTYGPDTLMSGAAAQDTGSAQFAATTAGVINGVGSAGQLLSPYVVSFVAEKYGWDDLFYLFVIFALIGGGLSATRWNHRSTVAQPAFESGRRTG